MRYYEGMYGNGDGVLTDAEARHMFAIELPEIDLST